MTKQEQIDQLKAENARLNKELDATRAEASKYCEAWESAEYMRKSTFADLTTTREACQDLDRENLATIARLTRELAELTEYTDIVKRTLFALIDQRKS